MLFIFKGDESFLDKIFKVIMIIVFLLFSSITAYNLLYKNASIDFGTFSVKWGNNEINQTQTTPVKVEIEPKSTILGETIEERVEINSSIFEGSHYAINKAHRYILSNGKTLNILKYDKASDENLYFKEFIKSTFPTASNRVRVYDSEDKIIYSITSIDKSQYFSYFQKDKRYIYYLIIKLDDDIDIEKIKNMLKLLDLKNYKDL